MDYEFRKNLYELDEIGFIGSPNAKETPKIKIIISHLIQGSQKMWKTQSRNLTDAEREQLIKEAERTHNREVRQRRKIMSFDKIAAVTL